jgi:16S rRNA (uracil1498-N3)-methyltransferase
LNQGSFLTGETVRQFFLETDPEHPPRPGDIVSLDPTESHHLGTVLRGGREPRLDLVDGRGLRMTGRPAGRQGKLARVEILTSARDPEESRAPQLVLACAVVKGRRFEWMLEKAVELGAHRIHPLLTAQGVIDPRPGKRSRWRSLLVAALKQSRRSWLPHLTAPQTLDQVRREFPDALVFWGATADDTADGRVPVGIKTTLEEMATARAPATLLLLVGPEGGWSRAERTLLSGDACHPVSLGPHVLRTETAAVVGLGFLQALRGQWTG